VRLRANVDFRDSHGRTSLMLAACNGHTRCLDVLINDGKADKQLRDIDGIDALGYAKNNGHGNNKLIKSLLIKPVEGYQVRGRSAYPYLKRSDPISTASQSWTLTQSLLKASSEDQLFNPCESTPFSNSCWRPINSELNPNAQHFLPSVPLSVPDFTPLSISLPEDSIDSSGPSSHSSSASSTISAPKRRIVSRKVSSSVAPIAAPMPQTLFHLLSRLELIEYLDVFENNGIDFHQFLTLTDDDLQRLGIVSFGHRKKLTIAQKRYHESLDVNSSNETFLVDYLLNERSLLNDKISLLEQRVKDMENANQF